MLNKETVNSIIIGLNIRSLRCLFDELLIFLENIDKKLDVIGLKETWLPKQDPVGIYRLKGCHPIFSKPRNDSQRAGGVVFYVRNDLLHITIEQSNTRIENLIIEICTDGNQKLFAYFTDHQISDRQIFWLH